MDVQNFKSKNTSILQLMNDKAKEWSFLMGG